jgi:MFS family permease
VAVAFLTVMALETVPSPLYGLYRARDHFSLFMVTVAFAVYAIGVIVALLLGGHLSDLYGRRRLSLPSVGIAIAGAVVFLASRSLPGLLSARLISGIAIGIVASTATAYLAELHAVGRPRASAQRAQLTASAVNVGGLAVGALVAGLFGAAVAAQFLTVGWSVTRELKAGMATMVIGIGLAVLAVWLRPPSPALFIVGGALIGAGSGAGLSVEYLVAQADVAAQAA